MIHPLPSLLVALDCPDLPTERADLAPVGSALAAEDPLRALALLDGAAARTVPQQAAYWRWLGLARLAAGRTADAELPLRRATALGDAPGQVAYTQWLLITGRLDEALRVLPPLRNRLPAGELRRRAQCLHGLALFRSGEVKPALGLVQALCRSAGSRQPGRPSADRLPAAQVLPAAVLAQMWGQLGDLARAEALLNRVLLALPLQRRRRARIEALGSLAMGQARAGQFAAAASTLNLSRAQLAELPAGGQRWALAAHQRAELEVRWLSGERSALSGDLLALHDLAAELEDAELRLWTVALRAELLSLQGQPEKALTSLYDLGTRRGLPPRLRAVRGLLMRRQRYDDHAVKDLSEAGRALGRQNGALRWRALLYLADVQLRSARTDAARATLTEVLAHLGSAQDLSLYAADLADVDELVQRALIEPGLAPIMQGVLARLRAGSPLGARPRWLDLHTLGSTSVKLGGQAAALSKGAVLVLTYLHLHPHTSRNDMRAALFPDFDREQTTIFFRTAVRELRAQLGPDILQLDDTLRHPRYRISADVEVDLDLSELRRSLGTSDLTRAAALYLGAFLEDMEPESEWADQVRQELRLAFNLELQWRLNRVRSPDDLKQAEQALAAVLARDAGVGPAAPELPAALAAARRRLAAAATVPSPT
ncbi:hypothetical protein [Deinococcus alpinitundrae]|uniref:hypothetical protein n=1 Tax=Deinococcus alpinitundrae TaxID=468913 RepID=UPI00137B3F06|nr:hypothetical protein [Deinococcus alpinitundrae]